MSTKTAVKKSSKKPSKKAASKPATPDAYIASLPADRREVMAKLRESIVRNIPRGFEERMSYGMIGYVVPHSTFPAGYHCDPKLPLPFLCIASQKSHIALYHMGIYLSPELLSWFTTEMKKVSTKKLDMGKSCTRWKNPSDVPFTLIGQLVKRMSVAQWIALYSKMLAKPGGKSMAKKRD